MNLSIPQQKVSVIIGANGCGKSTMLKTFARLLRPECGAVTLDGKTLQEYPTRELARNLGLLPQSPTVPEGIKVADLIARGRFPYQKPFKGLDECDFNAIEEAMDMMGVKELADRNVDELSGGQRQRVWIALALAQQTDILLLDEPTTYLDIAYQIEILDALTQLNREKKTTIVMVLHDINLSARYADYLFAMKDGKLVAQGNPEEIITPEIMKTVYGLDCVVTSDPVTGSPLIVPCGKYHNRIAC
ncbi:MAG: ABC transporter ATP-binding protein [Acetatifactor sp.]|nr:ABC transporter ATP-binding protein [Acetatifactor sp.]